MSRFHIAQINIARMRAPLESETMSIQPPDESFLSSFDWSVFQPCPAI